MQNYEMHVDSQGNFNHYELATEVILFEEHALIRAALAQNLRMQPGIHLLQESSYLPSRAETILPLKPEVLLIGLPQHSITNLQTLSNHIKVWTEVEIAVIVSTPYLKVNEEKILFESGIFAYILKTIDSERLRLTISAAKNFYKSSVDQQ